MTRCSWSPGFSRETTVRTFRTERHGKPKHVQEDHNSNDVVGLTSKSMASRTIIGSSVMLWVLTRLGIRGRQRGNIHCRGPHPLERGFQARVERHRNGLDNPHTRMQGTLGIVFVGYRPAEIDEQAIPEVLGHMPFKLVDDFGGGCLIGTDRLTQDFRVELLGELRGV